MPRYIPNNNNNINIIRDTIPVIHEWVMRTFMKVHKSFHLLSNNQESFYDFCNPFLIYFKALGIIYFYDITYTLKFINLRRTHSWMTGIVISFHSFNFILHTFLNINIDIKIGSLLKSDDHFKCHIFKFVNMK